MFPHYSEEARSQLGLPDSPVLHLAITKLADELMPFAEGAKVEARIIRITALRTASGAVREYLPLECAIYTFRTTLELPADPAASKEAYRTVRRNWMREAKAAIEAEGLDPGPNAVRMATAYGWNPDPPPLPPKAEAGTPRTLTDEHGRTWTLPADSDAAFDLLNAYGRRHGRISRAVTEAFRRHGQMNTLRMLAMRGAEGECINLAARALALGPIPPVQLGLPPPRPGLPSPEERLKRFTEAQAKRDLEHLAALDAEAEEMRRRGYLD